MAHFSETLRSVESDFRAAGIDPREALILVAFAADISREKVLGSGEADFPASSENALRELIEKRKAGFSISALTGSALFYGMSLFVTDRVFIPRPETESLIDHAARLLRGIKNPTILDVGTGSGAIILAVGRALAEENPRLYAVDISKETLSVAKKNAFAQNQNVTFIQSNLLRSVPRMTFDAIIANLPYLATDQLSESSIRREPVGALWGGSEGNDLNNELLRTAAPYLHPDSYLLIELDPRSMDAIEVLANELYPDRAVTRLSDFRGAERFLAIGKILQ